LALGFPHPKYLYQYLSGEELAEWQAFYILEPFGDRRQDNRIGTLASLLMAPNIKKGKKAPEWYEIFPEPVFAVKPKKKQSLDEMKDILYSMVKEDK
jgi:hypothetical protein